MAKSTGWHALSTRAIAGSIGVLGALGIFLAALQLERPPVSSPGLDALTVLLPGQSFDISSAVPFRLSQSAQGTLFSHTIAAADGMVRINLCQQRVLAPDERRTVLDRTIYR
jgi:hypothetical protein